MNPTTKIALITGDSSKAKTKLSWVPEYDLQAIVTDMMTSELNLMTKGVCLQEVGDTIENYYE